MTQKTINIGAVADDGTGDPLRTAFSKTNDNFTDLYSRKGFFPTQAALLAAGSNLTQDQVLIVLGDGANDGVYVATKDAPTTVGDFTYSPFSRNTQIQFKGPLALPSGDPNNGPDGVANGDHLVTDKAVWVWDTTQNKWLKQYDLDAGTPVLATKYMGLADLPTGNPNDQAGLTGNYLLTDRSVWKYNTVTRQWDKKYDIARTPPTIYMGPAALPTGNPNDIPGLVGSDKEYLVTEREAWYYDVATAQWIKDFNLVAPPRIPTIYKGPVELPTGDPNDKTGLTGAADGDHLVTDSAAWTWKATTNNWVKEFDFAQPRLPMRLTTTENKRNQLPNLQTNDLIFTTVTGKMYQFTGTPGVGTKSSSDFREVTGGVKTVADIPARDALAGLKDGDLVFVKDQTKIYEFTTAGSGGWLVVGGTTSNWPQYSTDDPTTTTATGDKQDDWMIVKDAVWRWNVADTSWKKVFDLEDPRVDGMPQFASPIVLPTGDPNGVITGGRNNQFLVTNTAVWQWDGAAWAKDFDFIKTPPTLLNNPVGGDPNTIAGLTGIRNSCLLTESAAWHHDGTNWVKDFDFKVDHDYKILANVPAMNALPAPVEGTLVQVMNTVDTAPGNNLPGFYTYVNGLWKNLYPSPADLTTHRSLRYDPAANAFAWEDISQGFEVVLDHLALAGIPTSHLAPGKLVYCRSDKKLYEFTATMTTITRTMADWTAMSGTGKVQYVARYSDLPNIHTIPAPENGALYVIRMDFEGNPYYRMVAWDSSIQGAPEQTVINLLAFTATDRVTDFSGIGAPAAAGRWYVVENPAGITPAAGEPYAGIYLPLGTKLIDCGNARLGKGGWALSPPDAGYAVGDVPNIPAAQAVDDLTQPAITGGWRFIDRESWVNQRGTDPDHPLDNRKGDFQSVIENGKKVLKVFDGTSWQILFDEQQIKGWIASLALFRGTVSEDPTSHAGTITWTNLPDLTTLSAAQDKSTVGQYWIWAGQDPFNVVTGTAKIGTDLDGAVLHVGDWLVIADRGNGTAGDPNEVDLRWVKVGGDLLTKSRGTNLFGLNTWTAGIYEQNSLVVRNGSIYRARQAIVATDVAPEATGSNWNKVPLSGGVKFLADETGLPATNAIGDSYLILASATYGSGGPAIVTWDAGASQFIAVGGGTGGTPVNPMNFFNSDPLVSVGVPIGTIIMWASTTIPAGWAECDGGAFDPVLYPEMAQLFANNRVPDLRGSFIRCWGPGHAMNLTKQQWTTGMPRAPFALNRSGTHHHDYWNPRDGGGRGLKGAPRDGSENVINSQQLPTWEGGDHTHNITGGDAETAPDHVVLGMIIKLTDKTAKIRT